MKWRSWRSRGEELAAISRSYKSKAPEDRRVAPYPVRCCFLTAGASAYSVDALLALGALCVFTKPISDHAELARTLEGVIRD